MTLSEARIHELLEQARAGDDRARASLLGGIRDRVFRWALVIVRDHDDAEDVTQRVAVTVHRKLADFGARSNFSTWLYAIVRNAALDTMRKTARRRETSIDDAEASPHLSSGTEDRIADMADRHAAALIRTFFSELPPRQRELVELVDIEGYSAADAARMLGIEPETARVHVLRGRRALRARMLEAHPELFA